MTASLLLSSCTLFHRHTMNTGTGHTGDTSHHFTLKWRIQDAAVKQEPWIDRVWVEDTDHWFFTQHPFLPPNLTHTFSRLKRHKTWYWSNSLFRCSMQSSSANLRNQSLPTSKWRPKHLMLCFPLDGSIEARRLGFLGSTWPEVFVDYPPCDPPCDPQRMIIPVCSWFLEPSWLSVITVSDTYVIIREYIVIKHFSVVSSTMIWINHYQQISTI